MRTLNLLFLTIALAAGCGTSGNDQHEDGGSGATGPDGAARGGAETGTDDGAPPDATSPTVDASADAAIEAASGGLVTVGARVVDWTGQGISELPVSIAGQLVHTDANGRAMATVRAPYDLVTLDATDAYAIAFYALTRSDPVVTVPVVHAPAGNATLAVNLTGTTPGGMIAVNAFSASIDRAAAAGPARPRPERVGVVPVADRVERAGERHGEGGGARIHRKQRRCQELPGIRHGGCLPSRMGNRRRSACRCRP